MRRESRRGIPEAIIRLLPAIHQNALLARPTATSSLPFMHFITAHIQYQQYGVLP